jgi:hypothetical protein
MQADFDNARRGLGAGLSLSVTLRPTDHLELVLDESART